MSRFLTILPNIIADYPKLTRQLANVLFVLYNLNAIKFDKLVINEKLNAPSSGDEDDQPMVEDYYRLFA